jgi:magnesium transporter
VNDVEQPAPAEFDRLTERLQEVQQLLSKRRLVASLVNRQEMPRHKLVETLVQKENLGRLAQIMNGLDAVDAARILEALPADDRLLAWDQVGRERLDGVLMLLSDEVREDLVNASHHGTEKAAVNAFELKDGKLRQVTVRNRADLAQTRPIWVDLVDPSAEVRIWIGEHFGLQLPNPDHLTDLEQSARFYVEEAGQIHLHADFLLHSDDRMQSVAVGFILHRDVLFSVRQEELPVFRLQRLRASTQPGYVSEGKDVLLDLFAADVEYAADVLEDIYAELETAGRSVLDPQGTDPATARTLAEIARGEDLNGRVRRNVLDTRRAVSFLMRGKFLSPVQQEEAREIVRDIESIDGHTTFLFGKVNFLMDATVGFINLSQSRRVSRLTALGMVFLPINILAGVGGMSEYSMMADDLGIGWPVAYVFFVLAAVLIGWGTYQVLRFLESRETTRGLKEKGLTR